MTFSPQPLAVLLGTVLVSLPPAPALADPPPLFFDRAAGSGLAFHHFNGMTGQFYFPEMTGQGGALLDYDDDGDLDVYLLDGSMLGAGETLDDALVAYRGTPPPRDRLFRNDLVPGPDGRPQPHFVDVTDRSLLVATGYGMGVATGDFDNDGWLDLYVTNYGPNQLWRNNGDGTFRDVTAASGTGDPRWSTSATFFDYDGDGWLDLYVTNYVDFPLATNPRCFASSSRRDYCGPAAFAGLPDSFYRNRGDGTFEDLSVASGIARQGGAGLGVAASDFDGDGDDDLFVANDGMVNFLWLNQRDGSFRDDALLAGVAVNREGSPEASMGVSAADFDGDGDDDLFMTHLTGETNTLYVNDGTGLFEDRTIETGLGPGSLAYTSFGTAWLDYDNDGWLDLLVANGAVRIQEQQALAGDPYPLSQPNQLFRNLAGQGFEEVSDRAGPGLTVSEVSRGAAFGDVDNDGDTDVLITNNNGPVRLLVNQVGHQQRWIGLELRGPGTAAAAIGATAVVERTAGAPLRRTVRTGGSYCSASDPRLLAGLGADDAPRAVHISWPNGEVERWLSPPAGRYLLRRADPTAR